MNENGLLELPNLVYCEKLTRIDAKGNDIEVVEDGQLVGLDALKALDLSRNRLESIPECIMTLPKLRELNLSCNRLQNLADGLIAVWPNLLKIDLSENLFKEVPTCLL